MLVRLGFAEGRRWSGLGSWGRGLGVGFAWLVGVLGMGSAERVWV